MNESDCDWIRVSLGVSHQESEVGDGNEEYNLADLAADFIGKINVVDSDQASVPRAASASRDHSAKASLKVFDAPIQVPAADEDYDPALDPTFVKHPPLAEGTQRAPHGFSISLKVPDSKVGLLIGKGGRTVRAIARRFRCKIWIPKIPDADDTSVDCNHFSSRNGASRRNPLGGECHCSSRARGRAGSQAI